MTLEQLFEVLDDDQYVGLRIDGGFHLSDEGTVQELTEEVLHHNGTLTWFVVQSIRKGEGDAEMEISAYHFL